MPLKLEQLSQEDRKAIREEVIEELKTEVVDRMIYCGYIREEHRKDMMKNDLKTLYGRLSYYASASYSDLYGG